jgi:hypothetical protein
MVIGIKVPFKIIQSMAKENTTQNLPIATIKVAISMESEMEEEESFQVEINLKDIGSWEYLNLDNPYPMNIIELLIVQNRYRVSKLFNLYGFLYLLICRYYREDSNNEELVRHSFRVGFFGYWFFGKENKYIMMRIDFS